MAQTDITSSLVIFETTHTEAKQKSFLHFSRTDAYIIMDQNLEFDVNNRESKHFHSNNL